MSTRTRKFLIAAALIFAAYAVWRDPVQAADVVHSAYELVREAVESIARFFDRLLGQ